MTETPVDPRKLASLLWGAVTIGCSIIGERLRVLPRSGDTQVILRAQRAAGIPRTAR